MSTSRARRGLVVLLSLTLFPTLARAYEELEAFVPCTVTQLDGSGFQRSCITCHNSVEGVSCGTPPCLNPFGSAFRSAGTSWSSTLAMSDADGDGFTNGEELGDPDGTWFAGALPGRCGCVTQPGSPAATPVDSDADGDGFCCLGADLDANGNCADTGEHDDHAIFDCDDGDANSNSSQSEQCVNDDDNDCDGTGPVADSDCTAALTDSDADGWCPAGVDANHDGTCLDVGERDGDLHDCDDFDNDVSPSATELCTVGEDEDCDGMVDEGCGSDAGPPPLDGGPMPMDAGGDGSDGGGVASVPRIPTGCATAGATEATPLGLAFCSFLLLSLLARRRTRRRAARGWAVAVMLMVAAPAIAQDDPTETSADEPQDAGDDEARALFQLARVHYEAGEFAAAAEEFERAYEVSHRPGLLYNVYVSHRDAGHTARAAQALERFLAADDDLDPNRRRMLERRLSALQQQGGGGGDDGLTIAGGVLLGVGGAALAVALVESIVANLTLADRDAVCTLGADGTECPVDYDQVGVVSTFELHRDVGWGLFGGGLAVAATGAVLLIVGALKGDGAAPSEPVVSFGVDQDGARATVCARF